MNIIITLACLVGLMLCSAALMRAADQQTLVCLTWEEERYIEASAAALPVECEKLEQQIAVQETIAEHGFEAEAQYRARIQLRVARARLHDVQLGLTPPVLPLLWEKNLQVGAVGRLAAGIHPMAAISQTETLIEAMCLGDPNTKNIKDNYYEGVPVPMIIAGIGLGSAKIGEWLWFDSEFIVTERRYHNGQMLFVLKPLEVVPPKLAKLVIQRVSPSLTERAANVVQQQHVSAPYRRYRW